MNKIFTGLILIFSIIFSCKKEDESYIPDVPVNLNIPVNDPRISGLNSKGNAVTIAGYGYAGLILYRRADDVIVAYDQCSTVNPFQKNKVQVLAGSIVEDKVSGALFNLEDGSPAKAPAVRPLRRYSVSNNGNIISVIN